MAITRKPWNGAASKYPDAEAYCAACLIDMTPAGQAKTIANCKLPVKEPNGDVNANALPAAAAALAGARGGVQASAAAKRTAARGLMRLYSQAEMEPPEMLRRMAGMMGGGR